MDLDPSKEADLDSRRPDTSAKAVEAEVSPGQSQHVAEQTRNAGEVANVSDSSRKRPRGPEDCLNYESSEDEFEPFTQSFVEPPKYVVATKPNAKRSGKKSVGKQPRKSSYKKTGSAKGNLI